MEIFSGLAVKKENNKKTALRVCAPGELHCLGLRMLSDLLEFAGWNSLFLGTNVPVQNLLGLCKTSGADLLALSATLPQHLEALTSQIDAFRRDPALGKLIIMVGGAAFLGNPGLSRELGADGYAENALEGLKLAEKLTQG